MARIQEKTPLTKEQFLEDYDSQDLVMKNLERAVQVCVDVANHILAVHECESLDYGRIYDAVTQGLGLFEDYARAILTYLKTL